MTLNQKKVNAMKTQEVLLSKESQELPEEVPIMSKTLLFPLELTAN